MTEEAMNSSKPEGYWNAPKESEAWQKLYGEYLKTDRWKELKKNCFEIHGDRCVLCENEAVTAHHRKYPEVFGQEDPAKDLMPMCLLCHHKHHNPYPDLDDLRVQIKKSGMRKDNVHCPVCDQKVKVYRRKLNSNMVRFLISLCAKCRDGSWVHHERLAYKGRDYAHLRQFGLAVWKTIKDDTSGARTSGYWKPTEEGKQFVAGRVTVPSHVLLYNNKVLGFSDEKVGVREALGKKFDYDELMKECVLEADLVRDP